MNKVMIEAIKFIIITFLAEFKNQCLTFITELDMKKFKVQMVDFIKAPFTNKTKKIAAQQLKDQVSEINTKLDSTIMMYENIIKQHQELMNEMSKIKQVQDNIVISDQVKLPAPAITE